MKATTKMTGGIAALGLVLALSITARAQQLSITPTVLDAHPTVAEFREEIARADAVVLAKIIKVLRRKGGKLADQDALIKVIRSYKGKLPEAQPCVRMEIYQVMERKTGDRLADVGDEVILPIEFVHPFTGAKPRNGQALHYMVPFYYTVEQDGSVSSAFGFPPGMRGHTRFDRFEKLILDETIPAEIPASKTAASPCGHLKHGSSLTTSKSPGSYLRIDRSRGGHR